MEPPIRTPFFEGSQISGPWVRFFQSLNVALAKVATPEDAPAAPAVTGFRVGHKTDSWSAEGWRDSTQDTLNFDWEAYAPQAGASIHPNWAGGFLEIEAPSGSGYYQQAIGRVVQSDCVWDGSGYLISGIIQIANQDLPASAESWDFVWRDINREERINDRPSYPSGEIVRITGITSGVPSGGGEPPAPPESVTAEEDADARYKDQNALVHTPISVTVELPDGSTALWVTIWATSYDGSGWDWINQYPVGLPITFSRVVPSNGATWKVKAATGNYASDASPADAVESEAFEVAPIASAISTGITDASVGTVAYTEHDDGTGKRYAWGLNPGVTFTFPTEAEDVNAWTAELYVQKTDASGNAAPDAEGVRRRFSSVDVVPGATVTVPVLYWTIPLADATYRKFRFTIDLLSRNGTPVRQACWPAGALYAEVEPSAQSGTILANLIDPATVGKGLKVIASKLREVARSNDNMVLNPSFEDALGDEWEISPEDVARETTGGRSGNCCVRITGGGKFAGQSYIPARQDDSFILQAYILREDDTDAYLYLYATCYDGDGAVIGGAWVAYASVSSALAADTWTPYTITWVCPAGTSYVSVGVASDGGMSAGAWRVDSFLLRQRIDMAVLFGQAVGTASDGRTVLVLGGSAAGGQTGDGQIAIKDASNVLVAWAGKKTVSSVDYYGIWGKKLWAGGSSPADAPFYVDAWGNVVLAGTSTAQVSFSLNLNSVLVELKNALMPDGATYAGMSVRSLAPGSSMGMYLAPSKLSAYSAAGALTCQITSDGGSYQGYYGGAQVVGIDPQYTTVTIWAAHGGAVKWSVDRETGNVATAGCYKVGANQVVGARGSTIADPSGGSTVDSEARSAIATIIDRLQAHGLIA